MTSIVWFRQDLRLCDNPALSRAAKLGPVVPVYGLDETTHDLGGAGARSCGICRVTISHAPFAAPAEVLVAAGVRLGVTYPAPIVDHAAARSAALAGYEAVKVAAETAT